MALQEIVELCAGLSIVTVGGSYLFAQNIGDVIAFPDKVKDLQVLKARGIVSETLYPWRVSSLYQKYTSNSS
jgi:hypothetical protein